MDNTKRTVEPTAAELAIGTPIHYTGDMANPSGKGTIVAHRAPTQWSRFSVDMLLEDGREIKGIWPGMFTTSPGQRFYLMSDWKAIRAAKIAQMEAEYAKFATR